MTRELARLEGVGKLYPRVHKPGERLRAFAQILAGREPTEGARVLHDINLVVRQGESLGIIGENGAGKSTLLKVLTGVIQPSRGRVQLNARHAALLELGAGFQPDFSGLENIRMKAALLGMGSAGLRRKLDQILEFADIGDYIHEPVKHYSSGMVVRLGFAVVAASEPELLITDEVLAVGDESFQRKCIAWIEQFLSEGGTLLFVSHAMYLVQKLCRHALWLQAGEARSYGDAFSVSQEYLSWHESRLAEQRRTNAREQGSAASYSVQSLSLDGPGPDASLPMGADLTVELVLLSPDGRPPVGLFGVVRLDGTPVCGLASEAAGVQPTRLDANRYRYRLRFNNLSLLPGSYSIRGHAMDPEGLRVCDTQELTVRVVGVSRDLGIVRLAHEWLD